MSVLVHVYVFFYGGTNRGQKTMWGTPLENPRRTSEASENLIPSPFDLDPAVNRAKVIRSFIMAPFPVRNDGGMGFPGHVYLTSVT